MAAPKNHAKAGGRQKGTPNKVSTELKEFYVSLLYGERNYIKEAIKKLRPDPQQYLSAIDKISNKVIANKKDITSDDKPIQPAITIKEIEYKEPNDE